MHDDLLTQSFPGKTHIKYKQFTFNGGEKTNGRWKNETKLRILFFVLKENKPILLKSSASDIFSSIISKLIGFVEVFGRTDEQKEK